MILNGTKVRNSRHRRPFQSRNQVCPRSLPKEALSNGLWTDIRSASCGHRWCHHFEVQEDFSVTLWKASSSRRERVFGQLDL